MIKCLIGNGGHAREVMSQIGLNLTRFVDDEFWTEGDDRLLPLSKFDSSKYIVMIAVGNSNDRYNIYKKLPSETKYFTFVHPTSLILDHNIEIGEGSFIGAHSILTTNIKIGKHALLNRGNQIGHDCTIGDFFSAMPGSIVSGNVKLGERVYIGTNSSIKEKVTIANDVTIGLNSGVVSDINISGVYGGIPCKKIN